MRCNPCLLCFVLLCLISVTYAQDSASQQAVELPGKYISSIDKKIDGLDHQLTYQSEKYIKSLSKQEEKMRRKLARVDSSKAAELFGDSKQVYEQLSQKLASANDKADKVMSGQYMPYLDSLQGSLGFLKDAKNVVSKSKDIQQQLGKSLEQVKQLQNKLQEADNIKALVQQRQQQIGQALSSYTNLPKDLSKYFGKYKHEVYYYSRQLQEYRESLNDPDKLVRQVLATLQTLPAFQKFMSKYSMLAMLFPTPDNYGTPTALAGLQTRNDVQQLLQQQLPVSATGGSPTQYLQQQMQQAQGELSTIKEKLNQLGNGNSGNSDMAMPDFEPNQQKTKSFLKRLEYGTNFQAQRASNYFPTTTDIAVTVGYKANDKTTLGIGLSGKIGWGQNWKSISVTAEGVGMRAFAEWRVPELFNLGNWFSGNLWLTAGAEMNYYKTIEEFAIFKNYSNWSKSALAGISKKYSMSSPLKKGKKIQGNMQVLYDFLYNKHIPPTPAFVWRVGYNF